MNIAYLSVGRGENRPGGDAIGLFALDRKIDTGDYEVRRRIDAVSRLQFPASRVVEIDADEPLNEVVLAAKRAVWEMM